MIDENFLDALKKVLNNEASANQFFDDYIKKFQADIDSLKKNEEDALTITELNRIKKMIRESREWTLILTYIVQAFILEQLWRNKVQPIDTGLQLDKKINEISKKVSRKQVISKEDKKTLQWIRNYMKRAKGKPEL